MERSTVIVAGATGQLGGRIAGALVARQARVIALVRPGTAVERLAPLRRLGVLIFEADLRSEPDVTVACAGAACVVSALAGLRDVIVDAQSVLLRAAAAAGVCWGSPDQRMDFTTMDDTAAFTASAALDSSAPRFLRIAGDELSARELAALATAVTGEKFRVLRAGALRTLDALITVVRALSPRERELYPAWQGMQYMRDMYDGRAKLADVDNDRYQGMRWKRAREVLAARRTT